METVAAYGMPLTALPSPAPVAMATPGVVGPQPGMWGLPTYVSRWETAAVGTVVIIGLALLANAAYDA